MPKGSGPAAGDAARPEWTWGRLARIATFTAFGLVSIDAALAPRESRIEAEVWSGELRNAPAPGIADGTRRMVLESPGARRRTAVAVVGSSVTWGLYLAPEETLPAQLAVRLAAAGNPRPVFNLAQPGGRSRISVPVAAAFGTHPVSLLLVEVLVPLFAEGDEHMPAFSNDEIALIEAASPAQASMLHRAGFDVALSDKIETALASIVWRGWRGYRLRGSIWWGHGTPAVLFLSLQQEPAYLVLSLQQELATAGFLPQRFHGQATNVGRLPWRKEYVKGKRPKVNERFYLPVGRLSESKYAELRLTAELGLLSGVPTVFFEMPVSLAFLRAFDLTTDNDIRHLEEIRRSLVERMTRDGLNFLPAPALPDDGFFDADHLSPLGTQIVAEHLEQAVLPRLLEGTSRDSTNRP